MKQASQMFGHRTVQALYRAIKRGRLEAKFEKKRWTTTKKALVSYLETKHSLMESKFEGKPLFNVEAGEISVSHAAKLCGVPRPHIYYMVEKGRIHAQKKGYKWVLRHEEIIRFYAEMKALQENPKQMRFA